MGSAKVFETMSDDNKYPVGFNLIENVTPMPWANDRWWTEIEEYPERLEYERMALDAGEYQHIIKVVKIDVNRRIVYN